MMEGDLAISAGLTGNFFSGPQEITFLGKLSAVFDEVEGVQAMDFGAGIGGFFTNFLTLLFEIGAGFSRSRYHFTINR
jgi:hypothetical protein